MSEIIQEDRSSDAFPPPPSKTVLRRSAHVRTRHCCDVNVFDWVKLISTAMIPLMIGVVTIIVTVQQQKVAQENRNKDVVIAIEQRKQDLEIARLRREEDKEASRLQRKEDMEMAKEQREQDQNMSKIQREADLKMAEQKLLQDDELAEKQRKLTFEQRQHELAVTYTHRANELALEDDRQKENILIGYQRDLASILLQYGTNLTAKNNIARFAIQMKTRTALRQLNPARRTILVRSLYDADILFLKFEDVDTSFLAFANLSYVDFGEPRDSTVEESTFVYERFDAQRADLRHASFRNVWMIDCSPNLQGSNLYGVDWANAELHKVQIYKTLMIGATFENTRLIETEFVNVTMDQVSFRNVQILRDCTFHHSSLKKSDWSQVTFEYLTVKESPMTGSNLSNSYFMNAAFRGSNMDYVDFSQTKFRSVKFYNLNMTMCTLTDIIVNEIDLSNVNMTGCTGFNMSEWTNVKTWSIILPDGTFKG